MSENYHDPVMVELMRGVLESQENPKVNEDLFVSRYLPILADFSGKSPRGIWMTEVSIHPYNSVDVMRGDKLIITVPPMSRRINFRQGGPGENVFEIINTAELKMRLSPVMGARYMQSSLESRLESVSDKEDLIVQWNRVFKHYGYPEIIRADGSRLEGSSTPTPTTTTPVKYTATEYDDF